MADAAYPASSPSTAAPKDGRSNPPVPTFAGNKPRSETVPLEWPIAFGGKTYSSLTVRRVSTEEIAAWVDAVRQKVPDARLNNVVDEDGEPIPAEVLDYLDPDDDEAVGAAITDFLPRRLREAFDSTPDMSTNYSPSQASTSAPQSLGSLASNGPASAPSS